MLEVVPLEIGFELLEQLHRHLEGNCFHIMIHVLISLFHLEKICDELGHVLAQGLAGRLLLLSDTAVQADGYLRTEVSFFFRHGDSPFLDGKASISKALWNSYSQKATKKLCKRKRNGHAPPQNFWWPSAGRSGIIRVTF